MTKLYIRKLLLWSRVAILVTAMTGLVRAKSCETSDGDQGVGVFGYYDETCINGGIGCWNSECRFCKKDETPQSSAFKSCPSEVLFYDDFAR
jgi:hypothetical protein